MRRSAVICFLLVAAACGHKQKQPGTPLGKVARRLGEASGLVASVANPGFLWTVNDSGNPAEVFLIDQHARTALVCKLANVKNRDWEDIGIDVGVDGKNYLYVADIGDNFSWHSNKRIYRFEEPVLGPAGEKNRLIESVETFVFRMPDGKCDAEAILIDPDTHDLFLISKRRDSAGVYRAPRPLVTGVMTFEKVAMLPLRRIVAGNISADGRRVLLKNYDKIYYWERSGNESIPQLLAMPPVELPYDHELQGEAIAWSRDGTEFFTLSESWWRKRASLIKYRLSEELGSDE